MEILFRGEYIHCKSLDEYLEALSEKLIEDLSSKQLELHEIVDALVKLGNLLMEESNFLHPELKELGLNNNEILEAKRGCASILQKDAMYKKVKRELFGLPLEISKREGRDEHFEGWASLGVLGHVTSSNDAMLPFLSAVEGLLVGNINIVKTATGCSKVAILLGAKLCEIEPKISPYLYVFPISSKETEKLSMLFESCDGIAVWGSEAAVSGIRELTGGKIRLIDWGHRISFAYVTPNGYNKESLKGIAKDICINEQQACSAPQVIYYDTSDRDSLVLFAKEFFEVLNEISATFPVHEITDIEWAEITMQTQLAKYAQIKGDMLCLEGDFFRVFVNFDEELQSSPLFRTIIIKPLPQKDIIQKLRPFRNYFQTVALLCNTSEVYNLSSILFRTGVTRIVSAGEMAEGYEGEPHDGVYALSRYAKRITLSNKSLPNGVCDMSEMNKHDYTPFPKQTPIMRKEDFRVESQEKDEGKIIIKSGGSSGKAVYAVHNYNDAQMTYRTAAQAMIAAGIDPKTDVCMNLFYCGDMYGGFISMYEALKHADITQLPMGASTDLHMVMEEIIHNKATVLIGMPTYLIRLFDEQKDAFKTYGGIKKVFYGGEHFDPAQIVKLKKDFNIDTIASLIYGCNEIGTIGYTCSHCKGTEHHVIGSKYMEILKIDTDEPVENGATGRIVLTPLDNENTSVKRYEIGDLGRWVEEPCSCGRIAPKFELLGRFGDIFKFGTNYLNASKIKHVFSETLGYLGWFQIYLEYDGVSKMTIRVQDEIENALDILCKKYAEIDEIVHTNTGKVEIKKCDKNDFILSTGGGKVRILVDNRKI